MRELMEQCGVIRICGFKLGRLGNADGIGRRPVVGVKTFVLDGRGLSVAGDDAMSTIDNTQYGPSYSSAAAM